MTSKLITAKDLGRLMTCLRKMNNMGQAEIAHAIGVNQPVYSQAENGKIVLDSYEFILFCKYLKVPFDIVTIGCLDKLRAVTPGTNMRPSTFKIHKSYTTRQCASVRYIIPLINYIKETGGDKALMSVLSKIQVDPLFFYCIDNLINLNFINKFIDLMRHELILDKQTFQQVGEKLGLPGNTGLIPITSPRHNDYSSTFSTIETFHSKRHYFETIFDSSLECIDDSTALITDIITRDQVTRYNNSLPETKAYFEGLRINGLPSIYKNSSPTSKTTLTCKKLPDLYSNSHRYTLKII